MGKEEQHETSNCSRKAEPGESVWRCVQDGEAGRLYGNGAESDLSRRRVHYLGHRPSCRIERAESLRPEMGQMVARFLADSAGRIPISSSPRQIEAIQYHQKTPERNRYRHQCLRRRPRRLEYFLQHLPADRSARQTNQTAVDQFTRN